MELKINGLTKSYGTNKALNDFTYTLTPGVYGLLGPNGAGKSTLMNILTDNLKADGGEVVFSDDKASVIPSDAEYRKILGFMPQQQGMYPNFTLIRFLYYMAALKDMKKTDAAEQIERLISLVNLSGSRNKRLGGFSGGMKQRALIAQALLGDPKIIILDEPTAGLDPKERIRIRNLIAEIAFDKIVMIATHVVSDIEFIAKEILLLKKGEIVGSGKPHELCGNIKGKVFEIRTNGDEINEISKKYKVGNISKDENGVYVRIVSDVPPTEYEYQDVKPNLEDLYLYIFDNEVQL